MSGHLAAGLAPARKPSASASDTAKLRGAFTLLEVILALAILVGSLALIGNLAEQGLRSARSAASLAEAQILCESKMAELTSGIMPLTSMTGTPLETDPAWAYSVVVEPTLDEGLMAVSVTVYENLPAEPNPTEFTLVRWMADPAAVAATESTESTP